MGVLLGGCKRRHHPNPAATIEEEADLASVVNVADPRDGSQLLDGFHGVEQNAWRWTMKRFSVSLAPPRVAGPGGVRLALKFALPDVVAGKMMGVVITPSVAGKALSPQKVTKTGDQTCVFDVPAELLQSAALIVEFDLDKAVPPGASDSRELGLVVSQIGFVTK